MRVKANLPFVLLTVFSALLSASPSNAVTIFNDFGPGDSFDTGHGWSVSTASSPAGVTSSPAMGFTSSIDANLTQIDIAIQHIVGSPNSGTTISLYTNVGGNLGTSISSWILGPLPDFFSAPGVTSISGITGIHLTAGSSYFLLAEAAGNDWNAWNWNDQSVSGPTVLTGVPGTSLLGAFRVLGDATATEAATPLPAALPLFASGAGLIGLIGWRRKKKRVPTQGA